MFKKSRRKIVASLVCVLALLFFGTVAVIYTASYVEVTGENRKMLRQYVEEYMFRDLSDASEAGSGGPGNMPRRGRAAPPMLELSTFYTVVSVKRRRGTECGYCGCVGAGRGRPGGSGC